MRQKRIGIDICNTLADIQSEIEAVLGPNPNPNSYIHPLATDEFFEIHPEVFTKAKPFPGAAEVVRKFAQNNEIYYVTARPSWAKELSEEWLKFHKFPLGKGVICSPNKKETIEKLGIELMIEDSPLEIQRLIQVPRLIVMRRKQQYNDQFQNVVAVPW